jgi:[ribosomal protein S18]-alanine N-acetyltransferase
MAARLPTEPDPSPAVQIVPMRRRHLRSVLRIESQVYPRPWTLSLFLSELNLDASRAYYVARVDGAVTGYGGLMFVGEDAHVTTLAVDPARHRTKIGQRLMITLVREALKRGAVNMTLEVRVGNEPAQALYQKFGMAPVGVRKGYYAESGEDAFVMWVHDIDTAEYAARIERLDAEIPGATVVDWLRREP